MIQRIVMKSTNMGSSFLRASRLAEPMPKLCRNDISLRVTRGADE